MGRKSKGHKWFDWKAGHKGKRKYTTSLQAWRVILAIWLRERHTDSLHPYVCHWTDDYREGQTGEPHIHIGHRKRYHSIGQRFWYCRHKFIVWPYFRLRRWLRQS
jgi:hypothetical protein